MSESLFIFIELSELSCDVDDDNFIFCMIESSTS